MKLPSKVHRSWESIMLPLLRDKRFDKLTEFLKKNKFLPIPAPAIFNAFDIELDRLRVVIVGQDPYKSSKNAHGLAFSIPEFDRDYKEWPPSLQVIAKDICGTDDEDYINSHFVPNLETMMGQGVLLLNKALTVGKESHIPQWTWFTEGIIKGINELDRPIIFYFLGNPAKQMKRLVTKDIHYIFESIHPAALAYNPDLEFDGKFKEISKLYRELHGFDLLVELPF